MARDHRNFRAGRRLAAAGLLACAALSTGCTLLGFALGASTERPTGDMRDATREIESLQLGTRVDLQMREGRQVGGRWRGLRWMDRGPYAARWAAAAQNDAWLRTLPAPARVRMALLSGSALDVEWIGADLRGVVAARGQAPAGIVRWSELGSVTDGEGRSVTGTALETAARAGRIPLLTQIVLDEPAAVVAASDVVQVRVHRMGDRRWRGALVGAAIDVGLLVSAAASINHDLRH